MFVAFSHFTLQMYSLFPDMCPNMFDFSAIVHKQFRSKHRLLFPTHDFMYHHIANYLETRAGLGTVLKMWFVSPDAMYIYIYTHVVICMAFPRGKWAPISKKWFPAVVSLLTFTGSTVDQYTPQFQKTLIINTMSIPMFNGNIIIMLNDPNCLLLLTIKTTRFDV